MCNQWIQRTQPIANTYTHIHITYTYTYTHIHPRTYIHLHTQRQLTAFTYTIHTHTYAYKLTQITQIEGRSHTKTPSQVPNFFGPAFFLAAFCSSVSSTRYAKVCKGMCWCCVCVYVMCALHIRKIMRTHTYTHAYIHTYIHTFFWFILIRVCTVRKFDFIDLKI